MAEYTPTEQAAIDRLPLYNSNPVSGINEYGMAAGGHRDNFPAALDDNNVAITAVARVANETVGELTEANTAQLTPILNDTEDARDVALASANFKGEWVDLSGALNIPASVFHADEYWMLLTDLPNVSASEPGDSNPDWAPLQTLRVIPAPTAISPENGDTGVVITPTLEATAYRNLYGEPRTVRRFQVDLTSGDFSSPVYEFSGDTNTHTVAIPLASNTQHKWRCRDESSNDIGLWMSEQSFSTGNVTIATPTVTVEGAPSSVPESPAITTSAFTVTGGTDTHISTDWQVTDIGGNVVWESLADAANLLSITVPANELSVSTEYVFRARHRGLNFGVSNYGFETGTTVDSFKPLPQDVFSTTLYTGNSASQNINTGLDNTVGSNLIWIKDRDAVNSHALYDTIRGVNNTLRTDGTGAQTSNSGTLTQFLNNGYAAGDSALINRVARNYVTWNKKEAPFFFQIREVDHTSGINTTIDLSSLGVVGFVAVKRIDGTDHGWLCWHRNLSVNANIRLDRTSPESGANSFISVNGTNVRISGAFPSGTYIVYAWAHDIDANGIIQCGEYIGNGTQLGPEVQLGWETQWLLVRNVSATADWILLDNTRDTANPRTVPLFPNSNGPEANSGNYEINFNANSFQPTNSSFNINGNGSKYIYIAIRSPII